MKHQVIEYQIRLMNKVAKLLNYMIVYGRYYQARQEDDKLDLLAEYTHEQLEKIVNYVFDIYRYDDAVKFFDHFNTLNPRYGNWIEAFEFDFEDYREKHITTCMAR